MLSRPPLFGALAASLWLSIAACTATARTPAPPAVAPGAANPAARKCVEDGHTLEPVLADGVPIDHLCIDETSGTRCEVWEYFRGTCRLP